ncbi:MAG: HD domain-containing protein [Bacilli bacterium]|nr:HD domain-containing protein [Bacilli bacterium]
MHNKIVEQINSQNKNLSEFACKNSEAIYFKDNEPDIRPPFFHDIDRIIYSLAFIRYQDKTQVFSWNDHDHVSKRMIHVQFVSKIARTIGRALGLNEDLIEAAALGHDLGHVPFGHVGERILNDISLKAGEGFFNHNIESVRNLMYIENYGQGLNISVQVLDAIMCHNGEVTLGKYSPISKTKEELLKEYEATYHDKETLINLKPMTLEGCVVRVSDLIAYLGRDIDDAVRLKLITRSDIPVSITSVLGDNTKDIVNNCILDIINNSFGHNYILLSPHIYEAIEALKKFNYEHIYAKSESSRSKHKLEKMFNVLYETYLKDIKIHNENSSIINSYLRNMASEYKNTKPERIVLDYIAGMTDEFFMSEYEKIGSKED